MEEGRLELAQAVTEGRRLSLTLAPTTPEIGRAIEACQAFCETLALPDAAIHQIVLALDELLTNIVNHGRAPAAPAAITVELTYAAGELTAVLSDTGRPFDPRTAPPADTTSPLADRRVGGLGVHLVRSMMDRFDYRHDGQRNIVVLMKRIEKDTE